MKTGRARVRRPPSRIVQAYFAVAHLAFLLAALALAVWPELLAGFFYQPRTLALVHLVTLGWISGSILGSVYALAPLAWRIEFIARPVDWALFGVWAISLAGIATHFWINEYVGMAWAASTVLLAIIGVGARVASVLRRSPVPAEHRWPVVLAFANLALAGALGLAIGLEKLGALTIPGQPLSAVYAHAHLAALGWATMMVVAVGARLLPMVLPARMLGAHWVTLIVVALQAGILALATGLLLGHEPSIALGVLLVVAAILGHLASLAAMLRARLKPPRALQQPDPALGHVALAHVSLIASLGLGLAVLYASPSQLELRLMAAYGVCGLVGFLSQLIVGIGSRILPLTVWTQRFIEAGYQPLGTPVHALNSRPAQFGVLTSWLVGLPLLTVGVAFAETRWIRGAAYILAFAIALDAINRARLARDLRDDMT